MLIDLDRFKDINDTFGHHVGDHVLCEVARRIAQSLRPQDDVARLGGDEFAVHLSSGDPVAAQRVAERLLDAIGEPVVLDGVDLEVGASIGIAIAPDHGRSFDELMRHADVAMYRAKAEHRGVLLTRPSTTTTTRTGCCSSTSSAERSRPTARCALPTPGGSDELPGGGDGSVGSLATSRTRPGVSGCVHTHRGTDGSVARADAGRPAPALADLVTWRKRTPDLRVAVNLSAHDLLDEELPNDVAALVSEAGVEAHALELEITETAAMSDPQRALQVLHGLRRMGIALAIDDYGVDQVSLGYLRSLRVAMLKIDRSFLMALDEPGNQAIVRSTVQLGRSLGLQVVAEGVESEATFDFLQSIGCDAAQGYWLARPVPATAAVAVATQVGKRLSGRLDAAVAPAP